MELTGQTGGERYVYTVTFPLAYQSNCHYIVHAGEWIGGGERYSIQSRTKTNSEFAVNNAAGNMHNVDWLSFGT